MRKTFFIIPFLILALQLSVFSQINFEVKAKKYFCNCENEEFIRNYFEEFKIQQKYISKCEFENEEKRKSSNFPKPVIVSGFMPSAISLVQPSYPKIAKRLRISGLVSVEVFTDENGYVIYSKILNGNHFLRENVRKAACFSRFQPVSYCGRTIKMRKIINYNFTFD